MQQKTKQFLTVLFTACNNTIHKQVYYIKKRKQTKLKRVVKSTKLYNMYNNYFAVFNSNKNNMCCNTRCKHAHTCMYAQCKIAYKHITQNTYSNMLLLKYLQFYSKQTYKYVNNYKRNLFLHLLTTQLQVNTCKNKT